MKQLTIVILAGLMCVSLPVWAQNKAHLAVKKTAQKRQTVMKKVKAATSTAAKVAKRIKAKKHQIKQLNRKLKASRAQLRALLQRWKQLSNGGVRGMTVRRCKKLMRKTFGPNDSKAERRKYLKWCEDHADIAQEPTKFIPR